MSRNIVNKLWRPGLLWRPYVLWPPHVLWPPYVLWPKSLYGRLALVWLAALLIGHMIQNIYGYLSVYDDQVGRTDYYLAKDLSILLPQLEQSTPEAKQHWIKKMARQAYRYEIDNSLAQTTLIPPPKNLISKKISAKKRSSKTLAHIHRELGDSYSVALNTPQESNEDFRLAIHLQDGTLLTVSVYKTLWPVNWAMGGVFFLQVFAVILFTWLAVKQATRSLSRLADAAEKLGASLESQTIPENGPSEVARAAAAFNAMQSQIKNHLEERVQILASISHDLQTPITRMRLRAELLENEAQQKKWLSDLNAMQALVEEGITYARSAQKAAEEICRVDIDALINSLAYDYLDAGQPIKVIGEIGRTISTRPQALKRIITNLVDNALKFASQVEIQITQREGKNLQISVLDRGPGIPENELESVMQPFYRVENSRNRETGGTGLGLAIAAQLSQALQGSISLHNREGGGLEATLTFPEALSTSL